MLNKRSKIQLFGGTFHSQIRTFLSPHNLHLYRQLTSVSPTFEKEREKPNPDSMIQPFIFIGLLWYTPVSSAENWSVDAEPSEIERFSSTEAKEATLEMCQKAAKMLEEWIHSSASLTVDEQDPFLRVSRDLRTRSRRKDYLYRQIREQILRYVHPNFL